MNLFETPISPKYISKGALVYYADAYTAKSEQAHLLQLTQVTSISGDAVYLDNGKKFSKENGSEITRGNGGNLYLFTEFTQALVKDAQAKLPILNEVLSIDFSSLTTQQLSMIRDVARGAFTQVSYGRGGEVLFSNTPNTAPTPCGGGCGDTVNVAGIDIEIEHELASQDLLAKHPSPDVLAPIAFTDATYELTEAELDAIDGADEDDEYDAKEALNQD